MKANTQDEHVYEDVKVNGKSKQNRKSPNIKQKKCYTDPTICDLMRQNDELQGQLNLKKDILDSTDRKNSKLYEENKHLKNEMKFLVCEKEGAEARLRSLGYNVENVMMSQDLRVQSIAEKWHALYKHEWNALYDEFCKLNEYKDNQKEVERRLLEITEWCYGASSKLAEEQKTKLQSSLAEVAAHLNFTNPTHTVCNQNRTGLNDCVTESLDNLTRLVQHYRADIATLEKVKEKCLAEYQSLRTEHLKIELRYVGNCSAVCWLMRITEPYMVLKYKDLEGTIIDNSTFDKLNLAGTIVEQVIWPALLRYENGPLVSHGLVRTLPENVGVITEDPYSYAQIIDGQFETEIDILDDERNKNSASNKRGENYYMAMQPPIPKLNTDTQTHTRQTPKVYIKHNPFDSNHETSKTLSSTKDTKGIFQNLSKSVPAKLRRSMEVLDFVSVPDNKKDKKKYDLNKASRETFVSYM